MTENGGGPTWVPDFSRRPLWNDSETLRRELHGAVNTDAGGDGFTFKLVVTGVRDRQTDGSYGAATA